MPHGEMTTNRLEAFSDGVIAVIVTIMVLEMHAPAQPTLAALWKVAPDLYQLRTQLPDHCHHVGESSPHDPRRA